MSLFFLLFSFAKIYQVHLGLRGWQAVYHPRCPNRLLGHPLRTRFGGLPVFRPDLTSPPHRPHQTEATLPTPVVPSSPKHHHRPAGPLSPQPHAHPVDSWSPDRNDASLRKTSWIDLAPLLLGSEPPHWLDDWINHNNIDWGPSLYQISR